MLKAMICQPMAGLTKEEILANRDKVAEQLINIEVMDTFFDSPPKLSDIASGEDLGIYLLSKSLEAMSKADIVIFTEGWQNARGCMIEHEVAIAYGKQIIEL